MKKLAAFVIALALACTSVPANLYVQTGTGTVYAAQVTAINSEQDLIAMQKNPKGNYYLEKDITITKKLEMFQNYYDDNDDYQENNFTGTLDGKGHKIKNYTGTGLFGHAKNAVFKNIVMTNVSLEGANAGASLVENAVKCTFSDITVSGKSSVGGAGIARNTEKCKFTNCTSKVDAKIKAQKEVTTIFAGIAWGDQYSELKNCKNKGNVTITGTANFDTKMEAAGIVCYAKKIENCVNSGNLTVRNVVKGEAGPDMELGISGIAQVCYGVVKGCGNTGNLTIENKEKSKKTQAEFSISGVVTNAVYGAKQCYNKGNLSFTGICSGDDLDSTRIISGIGSGQKMTECYNTGSVTANVKRGKAMVGGLSYTGLNLKNCYNTGTVSLTGKGCAGGIGADVRDATNCYNTGKVKAKGKGIYRGEIAGMITGEKSVYDNYYTGSGKKSGWECSSWVPNQSKAKKVSSITFGNCPKLSSKYWTYSNKYKRLILKNNKEA